MKTGFTILELLLVVSIVAIVAGIGIPFYYSFITRNNLTLAEEYVYEAYTRAQIKAQTGSMDTEWGARITDGQVVVFNGSDFSARDTAYDEVFTFSESIAVSGLDEVIFSKILGEANNVGTTILTSSDGEEKNITINEKGAISF